MTLTEFRTDILKLAQPRKTKINNSLGVYDIYKRIRKNKWRSIGEKLDVGTYYKIIKTANKELAKELLLGNDIIFPYRLGKIQLRKYKPKIEIKDNKLINNLPVDWDRTLKLWNEDVESKNNKILVKAESDYIYKIYYDKSEAVFNNKYFYGFKVNRTLKQLIKQEILNNSIDSYEFGKSIFKEI